MEKKSKLIIVLAVVVLVLSSIYFILPYITTSEKSTFSPILNGDELSIYQNSCSEMDISQAINNPSTLNGQKIMVKGQITKIEKFQQFDKNRTYIEMIVSNSSPLFYVIVSYADVTSFNVGNNITVYGNCEYPVKTSVTPELANKDLIKINAVHM